jgi:hypothetical protein
MSPNTSLPEPEKAVFVLVGLVAPFCYGMKGNYIARFAPPTIDPVVTLFCAAIIGAIWKNVVSSFIDIFGQKDALYNKATISALDLNSLDISVFKRLSFEGFV